MGRHISGVSEWIAVVCLGPKCSAASKNKITNWVYKSVAVLQFVQKA